MRNALQGLGLLLISTTFATIATAGQAYRWKDAEGQIHIGSVPPPGVQATPLESRSTGSTSDDAPSQPTTSTPGYDPKQEEADERVRRAVARQNAERERRCDYLRNNLAQINNNPRVRVNQNGVATRITEEQRQDLITKTQQQIKDNCQD